MTFISYAQNFEDVLLWRVLRNVQDGFYIDVGASHPDIDSVTRAFYDHGWTGINVEPVPELHLRLIAARPRDINLRVAAGQASGQSTVYVIAGTGLSTTDSALAEQHRGAAYDVRAQDVPVTTLAEICRKHAPAAVHFLKIDAEGAEQAVLEGADFAACRPWIVLAEATAPGSTVETHQNWEPVLLAAGYRFLYFDGLNRFYAADEHYADIAPHFRVPVCVFDDFLRAADTEWTRRISQAEVQVADLLERSMVSEATIAIAESRARDAEARALAAERRIQDVERKAEAWERRVDAADLRLQQAETRAGVQATDAQQQLAALRTAQEDAASLRDSTSWRVTAPLRQASVVARVLMRSGSKAAGGVAARSQNLAPSQAKLRLEETHRSNGHANAVPSIAPPLEARQAVHQFHSGSAYGDAITNAMLLIRGQLRALGYRSEIYVANRDATLADELRTLDEIPRHDGYVLLLHHSMGFDTYDRVVALPAPKILIYHNITPAELFPGQPDVQHYVHLGRAQLAGLCNRVVAALADSEFNALELHGLGFASPRACSLLFDLNVMRQKFASRGRRTGAEPFTLLFVGRVVPSKGQLDLLRAFARFRQLYELPSRLVLVGREDGAGQDYARAIKDEIRALNLERHVTMTGLVSDAELRNHYQAADLYVSLSHHEGFGVPLVEAAVAGVPVLAWPAGAVAFTLGGNLGVLHSRDTEPVAARIAELATDPDARAAIAGAQHSALTRFELPGQISTLTHALASAGATPPLDPLARTLLRQNMRFTIAGHVNGSYSLAAINRSIARTLERARPGSVRLAPVEGQPTNRLGGVPAAEKGVMTTLALRPAHDTGPVIVISQHYPVYVPQDAGDALLAYVFWEETRMPAATVEVLNRSFRGVLAPSRFVAKALVDSGVSIPIHVVGLSPDLDAFAAIGHTPRAQPHSPFTFLHVSSAFPRKGVNALLAAYAQAFRASDNVRLIIKTFPNPHNDAASQVAARAKSDPMLPAVELIDRDMELGELISLFQEADGVVLPSRGEGFNLPAAEAMAACIPLIVTGHGGHMDFCNHANTRLVKFRLATSGSHVATPLSLWADPNIDDLAAAMREVHDDWKYAQERARHAQDAISHAMSPETFVKRVENAALDAVLQPPAHTLRLCIISSWNVRCGIAEYMKLLLDGMRRADPGMHITILSDSRPPLTPSTGGGMHVRSAWGLGAANAPDMLQIEASAVDPDIILVQHQPGLLPWATLGQTVSALVAPHRVVAVTLHNTAHLLDIEPDDRQTALAGLQLASRVIVHTVSDIERLRELGLKDNVVLIPHGAPEPARSNGERTLSAGNVVTIGSYGFLLGDKGIPTLIEAVGILKARWPRIRLRLVNADYGSEESKSAAAASRAAVPAAGLDGAVEFVTDFLSNDESRERLAQCDVIALTYQKSKEGASGALRIALSAGPCVVVTPLALFDDAEDAVHRLPGTDAASIASGLAAILSDVALRESTREAAKTWLQERRWNAVGQRTLGMLQGLAASPREQ